MQIALLLSSGWWEVAVAWGVYGGISCYPGDERSRGIRRRLVLACILTDARLGVRLIWPQRGSIWTLLVLVSAVIQLCACIGTAARHKVLRGPAGGAVGQTHVTFSKKSNVYRSRRVTGEVFFFFRFLFTFDFLWIFTGFCCLLKRHSDQFSSVWCWTYESILIINIAVLPFTNALAAI